MKSFILKNKIILSVIAVIGLLSFAGARYEIYRLSPAPKNGQIIGEKDGKWQATSAGSLFNEFYDANDESVAYWGTAYNSNTGNYEWTAVYWNDPLINSTSGENFGLYTLDSKGRGLPQFHNTSLQANQFWVSAWVLNDTTGITVETCCQNDSTFRLVFSRADTLLKNYSGTLNHKWQAVQVAPAPTVQ